MKPRFGQPHFQKRSRGSLSHGSSVWCPFCRETALSGVAQTSDPLAEKQRTNFDQANFGAQLANPGSRSGNSSLVLSDGYRLPLMRRQLKTTPLYEHQITGSFLLESKSQVFKCKPQASQMLGCKCQHSQESKAGKGISLYELRIKIKNYFGLNFKAH